MKTIMDLADAYADIEANYVMLDYPNSDDKAQRDKTRNELLAAVEAQSKELETLRSNYNALKKMVDEGGVHERILSAGIEQEPDIFEMTYEVAYKVKAQEPKP